MARRSATSLFLMLGFVLLQAGAVHGAVISEVAVKPSFFNPSIGQKQGLQLRVSKPGTVTVSILDRDRYLIRALEPQQVAAGVVTASWDGKDAAGEVVPDEAYNLKLEFSDGKSQEVYDPSAQFHPLQEDAKVKFYSREDGVLSYELPYPSRVHAQAGQASLNPETKKMRGPILKTLVDDGPRVGGAVIEKWNGLDEGGAIFVPELPHFVVAVLATSLPPGAMITVGNRKRDFLSYAHDHRPAEATAIRSIRSAALPHHLGLNGLEDHTPPILLKPDAKWNSATRRWEASVPLTVAVSVVGDSAPYFVSQPTVLTVFVDETEVAHLPQPPQSASVSLAARDLPPGSHRIVFNWASALGPVAVNAIEVSVPAAGRDGKKESQ